MASLSQNLICEETINESACLDCQFKKAITDCEIMVLNLDRGFESRARMNVKIEAAEIRYDDVDYDKVRYYEKV